MFCRNDWQPGLKSILTRVQRIGVEDFRANITRFVSSDNTYWSDSFVERSKLSPVWRAFVGPATLPIASYVGGFASVLDFDNIPPGIRLATVEIGKAIDLR
jgi:hypothetical protein